MSSPGVESSEHEEVAYYEELLGVDGVMENFDE